VTCARCGSENAALSRLCRSCGSPLRRACPTCGFESTPDSTFCGGCGVRLQERRTDDGPAERRQLTVLFCDLVGSTELSQILDPEDLSQLLAAYQRICREAVLAQEGHIAQYLGDGVVMYFGYPRAHEDEAQRAVRCGLDILAGMRELRVAGEGPADTRFEVRLGAHTGRVVVGEVGTGDRKERIALGDTPNVAARIQSEAEVGTLTVSDVTWKIVEGYFSGKCLGESRLKGISEPMRLWLVIGESPSRERVEVASTLTPFVGREHEKSILRRAWSDSLTGHSQFVLVRGEPGMGKSRLVQLFREEVQSTATHVMAMRSTPYSSTSPFYPAIELIEHRFGLDQTWTSAERLDALEERLRERGLVDPAAVALFASLLSIPVGDRYPPLGISPARRRSRIMELFVELTVARATEGPTLLIGEDMHWADASTVELIELLVTTAPRVPLLGVFTARSGFDLIPHWTTQTTLGMLDLDKFERTEAEAMVRGVTSGKALPSDVLRKIVARSDGVPLFVEELTRSVMDSGVLDERAASWEAVGPVSEAAIPATVDASLTSRIDRLGSSKATAQLAATIGREFRLDLLREVSDRDEATLTQDLERLIGTGLVRSADDEVDTLVFKHALVRDAAYNSLLRSTCQTYHSRIAAALRERFVDQASTRPDLIAHHLTKAGEDEDAVAYWQAAGQQALARGGFHEAAEHFQRAIAGLGRLPGTPERQKSELELQVTLAPLLMTVHGWAAVEVERACERALALAEELQRHDLTYPPLWGLWAVRFLRGDMALALEAAERLLQIAQASGVPMIELTGRHATSYTLVYRGEFQRGLEEAEAGLALYGFEQEKEIANMFGVSSSVCMRAARAMALWMQGRVVEAQDDFDRMLQLGRDLQHPPSLAAALAFTLLGEGFCYSCLGQMERLAGVADQLITLTEEEDFFLWHAVANVYRGVIAEATGEAELARAQMHEGLQLFARTGSRLALVLINVCCAEALYRLGDDDEAFRLLDLAETEMNARQQGLLGPDIWRVRGRLLARQGERSTAEAAYSQAIERAREQGALSLELRAAMDMYELCAEHGQTDEGRALLAGLLERFTQGLDQPELARAGAIVRGSSPSPVTPSTR
jgi:class 3 adenylate cyclase/tetratricopeptide (TPR) repeat protein